MSADVNIILEVISHGQGRALDLGGGNGMLRQSLESLGYRYINVDIERFEKNAEPSLISDVHALPFKDATFDMVVSKDTLEHFLRPWEAVEEVQRILKSHGRFVIWVPFMHPFHGNDVYRYSPLGLQHLLRDFEISSFDSPLWVFTVLGLAGIEALKRMHLGFAERPIKWLCNGLDRHFTRRQQRPASFAAGYRIVAYKRDHSGQ
jgi:SAM-dependent methyltransferase